MFFKIVTTQTSSNMKYYVCFNKPSIDIVTETKPFIKDTQYFRSTSAIKNAKSADSALRSVMQNTFRTKSNYKNM